MGSVPSMAKMNQRMKVSTTRAAQEALVLLPLWYQSSWPMLVSPHMLSRLCSDPEPICMPDCLALLVNWTHRWSVPPVYEEKAERATVRSPQGSYLLPAGTERWGAGHTGLRICGVGEWMPTLYLLLSSLPRPLIKVFNEQTNKKRKPISGVTLALWKCQ